MHFPVLKSVEVTVNQVVYMPGISQPGLPYGFVYYITIHNRSGHSVQILGRKWIVEDDSSGKLVVEGEGVVGENPVLESGEAFTYNSCHIVASDSMASGLFFGKILDQDKPFITLIPEFALNTPKGV